MKRSFFDVLLVLVPFVFGCSTMEGPTMVTLTPSETIARIRINTDFAMMQVGDTLSLSAAVAAVDKSIVAIDSEKISWLSQDTSQLEVSEHGTLKAKIANSLPIRVIVSYKQNLNTVVDTALIYITTNRIIGANVRLHVIDSNRVGASPSLISMTYPRVRVDVLDNLGETVVKGAQIPLSVSPPVTTEYRHDGGNDDEPVYFIKNDYGFIGRFWVKAALNLYGVVVADSTEFIGLYPVASGGLMHFVWPDGNGSVIPNILSETERPPQLQPCGVFSISNISTRPFDVVFSDSLSIGTCDPLPSPISGVEVIGGNLLNVVSRGVRRIRTVGMVHYYLRDAVTKERLPIAGRYQSIDITE